MGPEIQMCKVRAWPNALLASLFKGKHWNSGPGGHNSREERRGGQLPFKPEGVKAEVTPEVKRTNSNSSTGFHCSTGVSAVGALCFHSSYTSVVTPFLGTHFTALNVCRVKILWQLLSTVTERGLMPHAILLGLSRILFSKRSVRVTSLDSSQAKMDNQQAVFSIQ